MMGTSAAYAAAITPMDAASKPMSVMNSFSTGTHSMNPIRATATVSGRSRRASRLWASTARSWSSVMRGGHVRPESWGRSSVTAVARYSSIAARTAALPRCSRTRWLAGETPISSAASSAA